MRNDFDAERAFAFGVDLQCHLAVPFEDRHICRLAANFMDREDRELSPPYQWIALSPYVSMT